MLLRLLGASHPPPNLPPKRGGGMNWGRDEGRGVRCVGTAGRDELREGVGICDVRGWALAGVAEAGGDAVYASEDGFLGLGVGWIVFAHCAQAAEQLYL